MPEIIVMCGLPGCGKTTWGNKHYPNHVRISSDDILEAHAKEHGLTYSQVFKRHIDKSTQKMWHQFTEALLAGKDIIFDRTNLTVVRRRELIARIPKEYKKTLVLIDMTDRGNLDRSLQERDKIEGKHIPPEVIDNMIKHFDKPTKEEGWDDIVEVKMFHEK